MENFINTKFVGYYLLILSFYSTAVSLLYLFGFWSTFDVNPFEYANVSDIVSYSIPAVVLCSLGVFVPVLFAEAFLKEKLHKKLDEKFDKTLGGKTVEERLSTLQKLRGRIFQFLLALICFLSLPCIWVEYPHNIRFLCYLGMVVMATVFLKFHKQLQALVPPVFIHPLVFLPIICLPFFVLGVSKERAYSIYENKDYSFVESAYVPAPIQRLSKEEDIKYIGKIGEYLFFSSLKNEWVLVVPEKDSLPLLLKQYTTPQVGYPLRFLLM